MPGSVQDPESRQGWGKVLASVESGTVKRKAHSKDTEKHEHPWAQGREWLVWAGAQGSSASWGFIHFREQTVFELGQCEGEHVGEEINAKDGSLSFARHASGPLSSSQTWAITPSPQEREVPKKPLLRLWELRAHTAHWGFLHDQQGRGGVFWATSERILSPASATPRSPLSQGPGLSQTSGPPLPSFWELLPYLVVLTSAFHCL